MSILLVMIGLFVTSASTSVAPATPSGHETIRISAFMFYQKSNSFDIRDLVKGGLALHNVIIGEGDALAATTSTLVVVQLLHETGPSGEAQLTLFAQAGERKLLERQVQLPKSENRLSELVPFLLEGTGCEILELTASVTWADGRKHSRSERIPFECGE